VTGRALRAISFAFIVIASCKPEEQSAMRPSQQVSSLRLGAILDLTGPAASFGKAQQQGIELAIESLTQSPLCKMDVSATFEDSRLDPKLAIAAASKLLNQDHVSAVVSITGSSMALATAPLFNRAKVPVVDSLSSAPALTHDGGAYYFRIQPADTYAGTVLVNWAAGALGYQTAAIIYAASDWGQGLRDAIVAAAPGRKLSILATEKAALGQIDFRATIIRLTGLRPNVVFLVAHPQEAGLIIKQLRELDLTTPILGSDSLSTDEVKTAAGKYLEGVRYCLASEGGGPAFADFQRRYQLRFHARATVNSIKPYDVTMLVAQAACDSTTRPQDIRDELTRMTYRGISGTISFDRTGDLANPAYDCFQYKGSLAVKVL